MNPSDQTQPSIVAMSGSGPLYTTSFIPKFIDKGAATFALLSDGLVNVYRSDGSVALRVRPNEIIAKLHGATLNNKVNLTIQGIDYIFRVDPAATSPITNNISVAGGLIAIHSAISDTNHFFEQLANISTHVDLPQTTLNNQQVNASLPQVSTALPRASNLSSSTSQQSSPMPQQSSTYSPPLNTLAQFPQAPSSINPQIKSALHKRVKSNAISAAIFIFIGISGLVFANPETPLGSTIVTFVLILGGVVLGARAFTAYLKISK